MDIKDLNKSQLILLVLLLSFVTSIATGITTVTLLQQAPVSVTTPINRVIQQTVEKIQQVEGKTTTQTVIVKEEDLVVDAIAKNKSLVFSITKEGGVSAGNGFAINSDGVIVADALLTANKDTYLVTNDSGKFKASFLFTDPKGFSFLKIGDPVDSANKLSIPSPIFGDLSKIKVGQKIIVLGDTVTSFIFDGNKDMKANISKSNAGGMVLDLDGEVLGIALSGENTSFASVNTVNASFTASLPPQQ
jgi:S1-C subfamily serine protease